MRSFRPKSWDAESEAVHRGFAPAAFELPSPGASPSRSRGTRALALAGVAAVLTIASPPVPVAASAAGQASASESEKDGALPEWLRGRASAGFWVPTETQLAGAGSLRQSQLSVFLRAEPRLFGGWKLEGSGTFDGIFNSTVRTTREAVAPGLRATWREGFLRYESESWDWRLGKQIVPWGKSDGINPTDFFGSKRQYLLWADEESKRFGADALLVAFVPDGGASPWGFQVVASPRYGRTENLVSGRLTGQGVRIEEGAYASDSVSRDAAEVGGKISYYGDGFDWDVLVFSGRRRVPQLELASPGLLMTRYEKLRAVGTNGSLQWIAPAFLGGGEWITRWEAALQEVGSEAPGSPLSRPRWFDSVLGLERVFSGGVRAQAQWVYRDFLRFNQTTASPLPELGLLRRTNALIQGMLFERRHAFSGRLSREPENSRWKAEVFALVYLGPGEGLVQPKVSYVARDALEFSIGALIFVGPEDQAFGALREYRSFFTEARWAF